MKEKEKWAEEWFLENRKRNFTGEGTFSLSEAWLAGFEFALNKAAEFTEHFVPLDDLAPKVIRAIGKDEWKP